MTDSRAVSVGGFAWLRSVCQSCLFLNMGYVGHFAPVFSSICGFAEPKYQGTFCFRGLALCMGSEWIRSCLGSVRCRTHTHTHTHKHVHARTHTHTRTLPHGNTHARTHTHAHTHTDTPHTHTHTYTHTRKHTCNHNRTCTQCMRNGACKACGACE